MQTASDSALAGRMVNLTEGIMKDKQLIELLYQTLETELGGVQVYTTALRCAVNDEWKEELEEYLDQTRNHVRIVSDVIVHFGLDPKTETPEIGRASCRERV